VGQTGKNSNEIICEHKKSSVCEEHHLAIKTKDTYTRIATNK
jgi:hypothetical protein